MKYDIKFQSNVDLLQSVTISRESNGAAVTFLFKQDTSKR
jgi:hypothetical protein